MNGGNAPSKEGSTDFTANVPVGTDGQTLDVDMPTPPDFDGQTPDGNMPTPPDFNGQAPDQTDIVNKIIADNNLDLNVDEMTDEEKAALLEQYKPTEGDDQNRSERPNMNGKTENGNSGIVSMITNIINKIAEDYNLNVDTDEFSVDTIAEFINEFMSAEHGRPDFQQGEAPTFVEQERPDFNGEAPTFSDREGQDFSGETPTFDDRNRPESNDEAPILDGQIPTNETNAA